MGVRAFIFDMDGTILDSLPDLAIAANEALARQGYPGHTLEEYEGYMGNGAQRLIERAMPAGSTPSQAAHTFEVWRGLYLRSDYAHTAPFPGVVEMLRQLRAQGMRTGIVSNKFDAGVRALAEQCFPDLFDAVRGELPPTPRKPDPTSLLRMLDELGISPDEAVYVGDTNIDVKTARNAGVRAVGVSWGYDSANPLPIDALDAYVNDPAELVALARAWA